jgi:iron complex transport system ATP-binding protein
MTSAAAVLEARRLSVGYPAGRQFRTVGRDIDLALRAGEMVCLLGPNGAGKTTLMRTLSGLLKPLAGDVLLNGASVRRMNPKALARSLSVVLTERVAIGMMAAYDLVALGRHAHTGWSGRLSAEDHAKIRHAFEAVQAQELAWRNVAELSDGERQRVMMARAIAQDPQVLILDEVTAFLDLPRRVDAMRILRDLAHREGRAVVLSTHDMDLAMRTADTIWLFPKGSAVQTGAPETLVLNGTLDDAFRDEGVNFDPATGSFHIHRDPIGEVVVVGDGLHAVWTARALERKGMRVVERHSPAALRVEVHVEGDAAYWVSVQQGDFRRWETLDSLLASVVTPTGKPA